MLPREGVAGTPERKRNREAMSHRIVGAVFGIVSLAHAGYGRERSSEPPPQQPDARASLRTALQELSDGAGDALFGLHFRSVIQVIEAADRRSSEDDKSIRALWNAFSDATAPHSPRLRKSYLDRSRPLIVSWVSPTDGQVSFAWLTLPTQWGVGREYPLYVQLHGLWDEAENRIRYLVHPFRKARSSFAFEDGYLISPWGRGNRWYRGIAETDIWECLAAVKALVHVDGDRQYLFGHSMGGYGAWHIARRSADVWAALGIHAGAFSYDEREVSPNAAAELRGIPTYFVVGTADGLLGMSQTACGLLQRAGNRRLAFVTFPDGHAYREQDVEQMYLWMRQFGKDGRGAASLGGAPHAAQ
jgi:hypothetical protein